MGTKGNKFWWNQKEEVSCELRLKGYKETRSCHLDMIMAYQYNPLKSVPWASSGLSFWVMTEPSYLGHGEPPVTCDSMSSQVGKHTHHTRMPCE